MPPPHRNPAPARSAPGAKGFQKKTHTAAVPQSLGARARRAPGHLEDYAVGADAETEEGGADDVAPEMAPPPAAKPKRPETVFERKARKRAEKEARRAEVKAAKEAERDARKKWNTAAHAGEARCARGRGRVSARALAHLTLPLSQRSRASTSSTLPPAAPRRPRGRASPTRCRTR
jgi:hypothetical protein